MKNIFLIIGISLFFNGSLYAQSDDWSPKDHNLIKSVREDGRFLSSYGVVPCSEILSHAMLFIVTFLPKNFENGKRDFAMRWKK